MCREIRLFRLRNLSLEILLLRSICACWALMQTSPNGRQQGRRVQRKWDELPRSLNCPCLAALDMHASVPHDDSPSVRVFLLWNVSQFQKMAME